MDNIIVTASRILKFWTTSSSNEFRTFLLLISFTTRDHSITSRRLSGLRFFALFHRPSMSNPGAFFNGPPGAANASQGQGPTSHGGDAAGFVVDNTAARATPTPMALHQIGIAPETFQINSFFYNNKSYSAIRSSSRCISTQ